MGIVGKTWESQCFKDILLDTTLEPEGKMHFQTVTQYLLLLLQDYSDQCHSKPVRPSCTLGFPLGNFNSSAVRYFSVSIYLYILFNRKILNLGLFCHNLDPFFVSYLFWICRTAYISTLTCLFDSYVTPQSSLFTPPALAFFYMEVHALTSNKQTNSLFCTYS